MQKFLLNPMLWLKSNLNPIIHLKFLLNATKNSKILLKPMFVLKICP